ncbi:MAG: hypothetical protein HKN21_00535, partial [Candidatus Eisenbacteria bacterium]|nr:hypothetical protein [Candidatus Eisenbacteria bacterium]
VETSSGSERMQNYQLGMAAGDRAVHWGASWNWSGGADGLALRENGLALGTIMRPNRNVSWGLTGYFENGVNPHEGVFDVGWRPFGEAWLTLFGDYSIVEGQTLEDGQWGVGAEVRPMAGFHVGASYREQDRTDSEFRLNIGLTFDQVGFHVQPQYHDGDHTRTSYLVRMNPPYAGLPVSKQLRGSQAPNRVVPVSLENKVLTYQKDLWFDDSRIAWLDLARHLEVIRTEPSVMGVAVNVSSFRGRPSLVWELREKLQELRRSGKQVYVYGDRMNFSLYYLASVADYVVLDPQGDIEIPGLVLHRTYLAGVLEKLGLGAEEWRFFSHKTAFQTLTRTDMSDADREQLQRVVDVIYETRRDAICESRGFETAYFDGLVDDAVYINPQEAVDKRLVDALGRWGDLQEWVKEDTDGSFASLPGDAKPRVYPDHRWGMPPEIALVYALGECAMDSGIRGRATSKYMERLRKKGVSAVVLRADSPGGDPLASDLIGGEVRKLVDADVPVVVSQGDVAASGGYWISMDGSEVLTTPMTVTGSIGVIAGWVWDEGFGEKTGLSADGVKRGKHADLFGGFRVPLLGYKVPLRNLDAGEKERVKEQILNMYDGFVTAVSEGRSLDEDAVRQIAEGRVWMGEDAIHLGLCDRVGTLEDAIASAKARAGLEPDEEVRITEYPPRNRFTLPSLMPALPGVSALGIGTRPTSVPSEAVQLDYALQYLQMLTGAGMNGRPLLMAPPEFLPDEWLSLGQ